jgi:uncharacterized protein YdhG (YjbR/CyaY superfamily)
LRDDQRAALEKLRKTIRAAAPQAEECISYELAAFRHDGRPLVAIGATANHCAFYLMSSSTVAAHQDELQDYDTSQGTIRFPADKLLNRQAFGYRPRILPTQALCTTYIQVRISGMNRHSRLLRARLLDDTPPMSIDD